MSSIRGYFAAFNLQYSVSASGYVCCAVASGWRRRVCSADHYTCRQSTTGCSFHDVRSLQNLYSICAFYVTLISKRDTCPCDSGLDLHMCIAYEEIPSSIRIMLQMALPTPASTDYECSKMYRRIRDYLPGSALLFIWSRCPLRSQSQPCDFTIKGESMYVLLRRRVRV